MFPYTVTIIVAGTGFTEAIKTVFAFATAARLAAGTTGAGKTVFAQTTFSLNAF